MTAKEEKDYVKQVLDKIVDSNERIKELENHIAQVTKNQAILDRKLNEILNRLKQNQ